MGVEMESFVKAFEEMSAIIHIDMVNNGFCDEGRNIGEALMLMVSELAEALENARKGFPLSDHIPEFLGIEEELADCIIRIMNYGEDFGMDIANALVAKVEFNRTRPYKHGKAF